MHIPLQMCLMLTSDIWPPVHLGEKKCSLRESSCWPAQKSVLCVILVSLRSLPELLQILSIKRLCKNIYIWSAHSDFWSTWRGCHHCRCSQSVLLKRFSASLTVTGASLALNYNSLLSQPLWLNFSHSQAMPFATGPHEIQEEAETIGFVQPEEGNSTGDLTAFYIAK